MWNITCATSHPGDFSQFQEALFLQTMALYVNLIPRILDIMMRPLRDTDRSSAPEFTVCRTERTRTFCFYTHCAGDTLTWVSERGIIILILLIIIIMSHLTVRCLTLEQCVEIRPDVAAEMALVMALLAIVLFLFISSSKTALL